MLTKSIYWLRHRDSGKQYTATRVSNGDFEISWDVNGKRDFCIYAPEQVEDLIINGIWIEDLTRLSKQEALDYAIQLAQEIHRQALEICRIVKEQNAA